MVIFRMETEPITSADPNHPSFPVWWNCWQIYRETVFISAFSLPWKWNMHFSWMGLTSSNRVMLPPGCANEKRRPPEPVLGRQYGTETGELAGRLSDNREIREEQNRNVQTSSGKR